MCWRQEPSSRPKFSKVIVDLEVTGKKYGIPLQHTSLGHELTPRIPPRISPDMRPVLTLPIIPPCEHDLTFPRVGDPKPPTVGEEHREEPGIDSSPEIPHGDLSRWQDRQNVGSGGDPGSPSFGTGSSILGSSTDGEEYTHIRMDSPPPLDEVLASIKDERRYRMLLQHEFHPSRTFPPIPI